MSFEQPPVWMTRLLRFYCKKELVEDLEGDLFQFYQRHLIKSRFLANLIYFIDVLKFCRVYTIRKPKFLGPMNFFLLFDNYLKTSFRNIARNRLFSAINIVGLAISMCFGILIIAYVAEFMSYDRFHQDRDRIYRIQSDYTNVTGDKFTLASNSLYLGDRLLREYGGYENLVMLRRNFSGDVAFKDKIFELSGLYASDDFFKVFSFEMITGNTSTALKEPNSIVLTETTALKLFDNLDEVVGQAVTIDDQPFMVTGLVKDPPYNSHIDFESLVSLGTFLDEQALKEESPHLDFDNIWMNYIYVKLGENHKTESLQVNLDRICAEQNALTDRFSIVHSLEKLMAIVPGKDLSNQIGPGIEWTVVYMLSGLTLIVLLSACFNYTNLTIARAFRRAKEIGIRKVVGASRAQLFMQFMVEGVTISMGSVIIGFLLYQVVKPEFLTLMSSAGDPAYLDFQWIQILYFVVFAVFVGAMAGFVPALVLSKLKALSIMRDATKIRLMSGINLRKVLIVFQFTLSIAFIISSTITYQQYKYALAFDLGFNTQNVLNVKLQGNDPDVLARLFEQMPEVSMISRSVMIPSTGNIWGDKVKYKDPLDSLTIHVNYVDQPYLELHEFTFLAGHTFPHDANDAGSRHVVINDLARKRFGFESPELALGEVLTFDNEYKKTIVGVVKDFQHIGIEDQQHEFAFSPAENEYYYLNLKIDTSDPVRLIANLESAWNQVDEIHPFEATFYNDQIQENYATILMITKVVGFLAFIAISIAIMGLLGMAVFTTETRSKEISIRKILGATEGNLVYHLSRSFMGLIVLSSMIAIPSTYLVFENLVFQDVANRIPIGFLELFSGALIVLFVGFLTIGWQTSSAARTNPAEMLRDE